MQKILLLILFLALVSVGVGFAEESTQKDGLCSLKITEDGGMAGPSKTIVVIDSKTIKNQKFLSDLWAHNRPLIKDAETNAFGPDARYQEIIFVCGDQKVVERSWHRLAEENLKLVVTSHGISALDGKTREEVLSKDVKWYLDFRKAFDDIFQEAIKFKESY